MKGFFYDNQKTIINHDLFVIPIFCAMIIVLEVIMHIAFT